jgi:hypothetical protein
MGRAATIVAVMTYIRNNWPGGYAGGMLTFSGAARSRLE